MLRPTGATERRNDRTRWVRIVSDHRTAADDDDGRTDATRAASAHKVGSRNPGNFNFET